MFNNEVLGTSNFVIIETYIILLMISCVITADPVCITIFYYMVDATYSIYLLLYTTRTSQEVSYMQDNM